MSLLKSNGLGMIYYLKMPLRCLGFANISFIISIVALVLVQLDGFANDPGVGWHLKTGEWILNHRAVPNIDPFLSYPIPRVWISDQWLSDLILFVLFKLGGWPFVSAFLIVVFAATYFLLLYPALLKETKLFILSALGTVLAFKVAQIHFILRPVVFSFPLYTFLFFSLREIWLAIFSGRGMDSLLELLRRRGIAFILLFVLWCNLHPSFVLGLFLLCLFSVSICIKLLCIKKAEWNNGSLAAVILALPVLSMAATLCNPYGWRLHDSILSLGSSRFFMTLHEEWQSPVLHEYSGQIFVFISLLIFGSFLCSRRVRQSISVFELLSWISFFSLTVDAVRIMPYFGIVSAPLLAKSLSALVRESPLKISRRLLNLGRLERNAFSPCYAVSLLLAAVFVSSVFGSIPFYRGEFGPSTKHFPYEAMDFLRNYLPKDTKAAVAASPNWGGFITFWGEGRIKPLIDDRNTLIGEVFYKKFFEEMKGNSENTKRFLDSMHVRYLLLSEDSRVLAKLKADGEFRSIFKDAKSVVLERILSN